MNKNIKKKQGELRLSVAWVTLASLAAAGTAIAGSPTVAVDWVEDGITGDWTLGAPLNGQSSSADSTGQAALEVAADHDATIESGASWDLNLLDPAAIAFEGEGVLTLDGDLIVEVDNADVNLASVGVLFNSGDGAIVGEGDLSVTSESSVLDAPSIITAGVFSNGTLDLSEYDGAITVTNDNSGGLPFGDSADSFPLPGPFGELEIDLEQSAVAAGVVAVDVEDLFEVIGSLDLGALSDLVTDSLIFGGINQEVAVVAISRDVISSADIEGDDDDDDDMVDANAGAVAAGVIGVLEDGVFGEGSVSATATANDVTATADGDFDSAAANTLGLAIGVGGILDGIADNAAITATSTSGASTAASVDSGAMANSISGAAAVLGAVFGDEGSIDGGEEGTVTISASSASGESDANGYDFSESASGSLALGVAGFVSGEINNAEISATSTANNATASSVDSDALAMSIAGSSAILGVVSDVISNTEITSSATSGVADAEGYTASANSVAAAGGALGGLYGIGSEGVTIDVTATAADAVATSIDRSDAISGAIAIGAGGADELELVVTEIIPSFFSSPSDEVESDDEPGLFTTTELGGVINATAVAANALAESEPEEFLPPEDVIEGADDDDDYAAAESFAHSIGFRGDVMGDVSAAITSSATSGNATAEAGYDASADSNAFAVGLDGDMYTYGESFPEIDLIEGLDDDDDDDDLEFSGAVVATATAGDAEATADYDADALANAEAHGTGDLNGTVSGTVEATATGGNATASTTFGNDDYEYPEDYYQGGTSANAEAFATGTEDIGGDVLETAAISATATGGTALATSFFEPEPGEIVTGGDAYASSHADAYAINGTLESSDRRIVRDAIEGDHDEELDLIEVAGTITASATSTSATATAYNYAEADAQAHADGVDVDYDDVYANISADFVSTAISGTATATSLASDDDDDDDDDSAEAYVDTRAVALNSIDDYTGNFTGSVDSTAQSGTATATSASDYAEATASARAYGVDFSDGDYTSFHGDHSAETTLLAEGGTATASSEGRFYSEADTDSEARVAAISDLKEFEGDFTALVNGTSTAGTASSTADTELNYNSDSYADAYAVAEAYGIQFYKGDDDDDDDDDSSFTGTFDADVTLAATGGTAIATATTGDDDDDDDDDSSSEAYADASAEVAAISGVVDFYGDFGGTVDLTGQGGTATADADTIAYYEADSEAFAYASSEVIALEISGSFQGEVEEELEPDDGVAGLFDADVTIVSNGGTASATATGDGTSYFGDDDDDDDDYGQYGQAEAYANARATSIGEYASRQDYDDDDDDDDDFDYFYGDLKGSHNLTATAGSATANGLDDANANAFAGVEVLRFSDEGDFTGDIDADIDIAATGGTTIATATEGSARAVSGAGVYVIDYTNNFTGDFKGTVDVTADGGTATATGADRGSAYAYVDLVVIDEGDGLSFNGEFAATVDLTATGGTATATGTNTPDFDDDDDDDGGDARANAEVEVEVLDNVEFAGIFSGDVTMDLTAGTATADAVDRADAEAYVAAVVLDMDGNFSGELPADDIEAIAPSGTFSSQVDITALAGDANADSVNGYAGADAFVTAYAIDANGNDIIAEFTSDASFDIDATAGTATAGSRYGEADADASVEANAIEYAGNIVGDIAAPVTIVGKSGTAAAYAGEDSYANAGVDVEGFKSNYNNLTGDVSGDISLTADASEAIALAYSEVDPFGSSGDDDDDSVDASSDAGAHATALSGFDTIYGNISSTINNTATAGQAYATSVQNLPRDEIDGDILIFTDLSANAIADAMAHGIEGDVEGTVSSDMTLTANNADAIAYAQAPSGHYAYASASADSVGIDGDVSATEADEALTGSFTQTSVAGLAYAQTTQEDFFFMAGDAVEAIDGDDDDDSETYAYATANSTGVEGDVAGDVTADFNLQATGGTAVASTLVYVDGPFFYGQDLEAEANASAVGIDGGLDGDFSGDIIATATGGTAINHTEITEFDRFTDPIEGGELEFETARADASAKAVGIGDGESDIISNMSGSISATATGGIAASLTEVDFFDLDEIDGDAIDTTLDIADSEVNAAAFAAGVYGNVESEVASTAINVAATGGETTYQFSLFGMDDPIDAPVSIPYPGDASALAAGVIGNSIVIGEYGAGELGAGGIIATATPGLVFAAEPDGPFLVDVIEGDDDDDDLVKVPLVPETPSIPEPFDAYVDNAFAAGFMTYDRVPEMVFDDVESIPSPIIENSLLDIVISTFVHTFVEAPEGFTTDDFNSYTAAVYSGQGDDMVELAEGADIIGDINTGGGLNTLTVTGNTVMEGNILSTALDWIDDWLGTDNGAGTIDFDIDSGLFTAVRTVNVSDLEDMLEIAAAGGLAPILSQNQADELPDDLVQTSRINVTGDGSTDVSIAAGATLLPVFDESVVFDGLVGQKYELIAADGLIDDQGALADGSLTPYNFTTFYEDDDRDSFGIIVDSIRVLDEEETPGTVQTSDAVATATQAVMLDMSKHASLLRSILRRKVASTGEAPIGAAGPGSENALRENGMRQGEWLGYVSVFGNIGQQESEGGFAGFDYDTYGFTVGFEKLFGDQLILGIAGTYADTDVTGMSGSGGGDSELYSGAVYVNWFTDTWYTEGGLMYGEASNDVTRVGAIDNMNTLGSFRGSNDSTMIGGWLEVGHTFRDNAFSYEPYARVTYVYGDHDGYRESGPNPVFEQNVDDDTTQNLKTELGLRLSHEWFIDNGGSFVLETKVGWEHEWADNNVSIDTTYLGDPFELQSADSDEDALVLGLRAEWQNGEGFAIGLEYEPTLSSNWYNHSFSGTLQYSW